MTNQEKPSFTQEDFLTLDEEQLEEVTGTGNCCVTPNRSNTGRIGKKILPNIIYNHAGNVATVDEAQNMWQNDHQTQEERDRPRYWVDQVTINNRQVPVRVPPRSASNANATQGN